MLRPSGASCTSAGASQSPPCCRQGWAGRQAGRSPAALRALCHAVRGARPPARPRLAAPRLARAVQLRGRAPPRGVGGRARAAHQAGAQRAAGVEEAPARVRGATRSHGGGGAEHLTHARLAPPHLVLYALRGGAGAMAAVPRRGVGAGRKPPAQRQPGMRKPRRPPHSKRRRLLALGASPAPTSRGWVAAARPAPAPPAPPAMPPPPALRAHPLDVQHLRR